MQRISQPAPALLDISLRYKKLEEALGSALVAHQSAISLGERTGGQHDLRFPSGLVQQVVDHDDVASVVQAAIDGRTVSVPIEIVFEYDDDFRGILFHHLEGVLQRATAEKA